MVFHSLALLFFKTFTTLLNCYNANVRKNIEKTIFRLQHTSKKLTKPLPGFRTDFHANVFALFPFGETLLPPNLGSPKLWKAIIQTNYKLNKTNCYAKN
jgi:hypothetical protein